MFLNIQIDWIILKTYAQQFTLTTKKSLHIIFKARTSTEELTHVTLQSHLLTENLISQRNSSQSINKNNRRDNTDNDSNNNSQLQMWANAQRDGRSAEYRWRPLFNAAKLG